MPLSTAPTTAILGNGLTWTECVIPFRDYYHTIEDIPIITGCLGMDFPRWEDDDRGMVSEHTPNPPAGDDLRLVIGDDVYETRYQGERVYELLRNGEVIAAATAHFVVGNPNRQLWNIGGVSVWELAGAPPDILVDGVSLNESQQLDGSYFPYQLHGKLIYIARHDDRFRIVYDGEAFGPEFESISVAYCCARISVLRGGGQYWFLGQSGGTMVAVVIQ